MVYMYISDCRNGVKTGDIHTEVHGICTERWWTYNGLELAGVMTRELHMGHTGSSWILARGPTEQIAKEPGYFIPFLWGSWGLVN